MNAESWQEYAAWGSKHPSSDTATAPVVAADLLSDRRVRHWHCRQRCNASGSVGFGSGVGWKFGTVGARGRPRRGTRFNSSSLLTTVLKYSVENA